MTAALADRLARAGFVAAPEEAGELVAAAGGDPVRLEVLTDRRLRGEPLAWITGRAAFGDVTVDVHPGVYVPRWQSLELARRATARLPARGTAVDLCTGSGAIAVALRARRPRARIVATDTDPRALACARANGVEAYGGDLFAALPPALRHAVDVVVAVVPYVPAAELGHLPRHTLEFEDAAHYDGGPDGTEVLTRLLAGAPGYLRPGGSVLLELGGTQGGLVRSVMEQLGCAGIETWCDEDGDPRGVEARLGP